MMIHDILKIKYVKLGYICKNYPYHMISDTEMFNAFMDLGDDAFNEKTTIINPKVRFFDKYYPNPFDADDVYIKTDSKGEIVSEISLSGEYEKLKKYIKDTINAYLEHYGTLDEDKYLIPNWIYTYMLGEVVYKKSEYLDIEDTLALLDCSNLDNEFTKEACIACYKTSLSYVSTLTTGSRPATMFGEPHVIKQLRMAN